MKRIALILLSVFVIGTAALLIFSPKQVYSAAERRRLAKMPEISLESVLNGSYVNAIETYLLDHFPYRDKFRGIKALYAANVLMQKENNGIYVVGNHASKLEYPLNKAGVDKNLELALSLQKAYFPENRVFYTVIPDKNYFLAEKNGYPHIDYSKMLALLSDGFDGKAQYIDIISKLTIDDYYKTDAHWRQEKIGGAADALLKGMGVADAGFDIDAYEQKIIEDFYGVYRGQAALSFPAENIIYLENEATQNAYVYDAESKSGKTVYQPLLSNSLDAYDVYLGGARSLLIISNDKLKSEEASGGKKRVIMFRDSFGSSLAPLLIGHYDEITLVDLRYMSAGMIGEYVDFADADVIFAYNTLIWNNGSILKK